MYSKKWTTFETTCVAFNTLRKALYPEYLVRGWDNAISIWKPTEDPDNPTFLLNVFVEATKTKEESKFTHLYNQNYLLAGGDMAYKAADLIRPLLT